MSTTPSQAHSSQQGPGRNPRGRGQGNRRPNRPVLPLTQPIPGYAGLRYDTQLLSPASAGRAAEGIEAGFILHKLRRIADGQDRYMAFQLYTPVAVRVYDPDVQRRQQDRVTCNCLDYQSTQSACAHLYVSSYLVYTIIYLPRIVAIHTLERRVGRGSTRKPARLDADRSDFWIVCSVSSNRAKT